MFFQERNAKTEELHQETLDHYEKVINDLKTGQKSLESNLESVGRELSQVRSEKSELVEMNDNLSNQISEQLNSMKKLQDKEQDLLQKLDNVKRDLELAHNGMTSELHKHWEAEDDLINLQTILDETDLKLQESNAQVHMLTKKLSATQNWQTDYESLLTQFNSVQVNLDQKESENQALKNQMSKKETLILELKEQTKKLKNVQIENEKLSNSLDINKHEISSLNLSLEAQQKLIAEKEADILAMTEQLVQADHLTRRLDDLQTKLDEQDEDLEEVKSKNATLENQIQDKETKIKILKQELQAQESQAYKEKYETLVKMVEPFRSQLESYEMERNALLAEKQGAQGKVQKLFSDYTNLLGHQNHKQKIHHLVRLKQENLDMREELAKVNLELTKHKRMLTRYKNNAGKENAFHNTPLMTPVQAVTTRRQTIASPLANRNTQH